MITLIGHGYIGQAIAQELSKNHQFIWIDHQGYIPKSTSVIINAAGYTGSPNVDACEHNKMATIEGNVVYPLNLEYQNPNTPIVHVTSGCVYTGYKDGGWTEDDEANFTFANGSWYSGTKALAEKLLKPYMNKSYLLRIRMPFDSARHPKNLLTKLETYTKLIDFKNSLSYVPDIAAFAVFCATKQPAPGVYNVCNPGSKTTKQIANAMGLQKEWFTPDEFAAYVAAPRSNCVLNTDKLSKIYPIKHVDTAIAEAIAKYH